MNMSIFFFCWQPSTINLFDISFLPINFLKRCTKRATETLVNRKIVCKFLSNVGNFISFGYLEYKYICCCGCCNTYNITTSHNPKSIKSNVHLQINTHVHTYNLQTICVKWQKVYWGGTKNKNIFFTFQKKIIKLIIEKIIYWKFKWFFQ